MQNVWAWQCSYDKRRLETLTDMNWHVVMVKASKKDDLKRKISSISVETTDSGTEKSLAEAEIVDLTCNNATFTKLGDSCKYKLRMKYKAEYPEDQPIEATVNTSLKDVYGTESGLCNEKPDGEQIQFNFRKNDFISLVRFAEPEEYIFYPALRPSGDQEYAVLVVENGYSREIKLTGIKKVNASWLALINKKTDAADPLYGNSKQCTDKEDKEGDLTVNRLEHAGDSCILVYSLKNAPIRANNPSIDIEMLGGETTKDIQSIRVDQVLKPLKVVISNMQDIGVQPRISTEPEVPQHLMTVQNYYSSDLVKPIIKIYNEATGEEVKDKFAVISSLEDCIKNPKDCNKFNCNLTYKEASCSFRIIPKSSLSKNGDIWSEFKTLHGDYFVKVFYKGQEVSDKKSFKVLDEDEIVEAAEEFYAYKRRTRSQ
jgi:hypothetical protein